MATFPFLAGCEFEVVEAPLEEPVLSHYRAAARMWNQLRREFLYAAEQVSGKGKPHCVTNMKALQTFASIYVRRSIQTIAVCINYGCACKKNSYDCIRTYSEIQKSARLSPLPQWTIEYSQTHQLQKITFRASRRPGCAGGCGR